VQHVGCLVLANLADNDANQEKISELGGIEVVVAAMSVHRGNADVQAHGCWSLNNITRTCKDVQTKAKALGIIVIVIAAMKAFPRNSTIAADATAVLKRF
jgi:hypothetical protein